MRGGGGRGVVSYVFGFSRRLALRYSLKYNVLSLIIWIALLISMFYYTLAMRNFIDYLVSFSRVSVGSWLAGVLRYALVLLGLWGSTYVLNTFGEYVLQLAKLATLRGLASEFVKRISLAKPDVVPERGDVVGRFMSDLNQVSQLGLSQLPSVSRLLGLLWASCCSTSSAYSSFLSHSPCCRCTTS